MFEQLQALPNDPILRLMSLCRDDPRDDKIDVGVGVFKTPTGETPVMRAVREAEKRLHDSQRTKTYVGIAGDPIFDQAMIDLVFADSVDHSRVRAVQAPGGSGALRITADMLHRAMPDKTVWVSDPTWGNHTPIFEAAGFTVKTYPYFDTETKRVDEEKVLDALNKLGKDDIVLLHGCCHNPTGSDMSQAAWNRLADIALERGFLPFIDLAYQGLGLGLSDDLYGTRKLASVVPNLIVTNSCSKNFGLYRERVGCAMILAKDSAAAEITQKHLTIAARVAYSMPPDHGAAIVGIIMTDAELRKQWEEELGEMRHRILWLRALLSAKLRDVTGNHQWDFISEHHGMFSLLCLDKAQTDALVNEHSIYIVNGGRINIAGLKDEAQVARFAECLIEVTQK